jgi:chitodextrinase
VTGPNGIVSGYNNIVVTGTSAIVNGLQPSTQYSYQLTASNAFGTSPLSNTVFVTTMASQPPPDAPTATAATAVTQTGFTANWTLVVGASSYRLDVATDNAFTNLLPGYNNLNVSGTSQAVTGLTPGATYHYRVRAVNANGTSSNSNAVQVTTPAPAGETFYRAINIGPTTGVFGGILYESHQQWSGNAPGMGNSGYNQNSATVTNLFPSPLPDGHTDAFYQQWMENVSNMTVTGVPNGNYRVRIYTLHRFSNAQTAMTINGVAKTITPTPDQGNVVMATDYDVTVTNGTLTFADGSSNLAAFSIWTKN